jgi:GGDEF domain-containing protein
MYTQMTTMKFRDAANHVLRAFVGLSTPLLREGADWIGRVGGDEFIIVCRRPTLDGSSRVAERLRTMLAEGICPTRAGPILSGTVSKMGRHGLLVTIETEC